MSLRAHRMCIWWESVEKRRVLIRDTREETCLGFSMPLRAKSAMLAEFARRQKRCDLETSPRPIKLMHRGRPIDEEVRAIMP
jgi:hypothetical protein